MIVSLGCLHLVLLGVHALGPELLGLEHLVVTGGSTLLFFRGDSPVATQEPLLPPNLYIGVVEGIKGGGVLGSSSTVPSSISILALTVVILVVSEVVVFLNKYFIVFISLFPRTD